ncbi:hypothetical protein LZK98_11835 [Sphingomonas cannabina]|uniref:hypothetical protein n=1 Tax=Sphingomonas cannabina TaxID=2899123 RepID=UPI001F30BD6F|nr:hypothetical protein [Sphingomonas cannabina]UIJ43782.1 hypothetical protein LZK98_11835 [Sphingomonas cannabina]
MAGRPSSYDPEYCQQLVDHMATGASVASFAAEIDVARSTINEWASKHPEFSEALARGKAKCAAWWEKIGRSVAETGDGSATMVIFGLRNMADTDWQDVQKRELSGPGGRAIEHNVKSARDLTDDELAAIASRGQ